jgi:2-iminobutanoate/2-iminopropanoate deaminase
MRPRRLAAVLLTALSAAACAAPGPEADREVIRAPDAPEAIGPYSQAVRVGSTLYVAGQIGIDPATGELVAGGIEPETRQVLRNLRAIVEAAGFDMADVVQAQVFLADLDDYPAMNALYAEAFPGDPPARATVEVSRIPAGARVEISLVAVAPGR